MTAFCFAAAVLLLCFAFFSLPFFFLVLRRPPRCARVRVGWASYLNAPDPSDVDATLQLPRMAFPGIDPAAATFLVAERRCVPCAVAPVRKSPCSPVLPRTLEDGVCGCVVI